MPRKQQGWITFQSSEEERQILEQHCQQSQRSKTEVLRELVRSLSQKLSSSTATTAQPNLSVEATKVESFNQESSYQNMKISARNTLKGTIKRIVTGAVNTEVTIEVAPAVEITAIITKTSAEQLGLAEGKEAYAVIKSSNVMIAID